MSYVYLIIAIIFTVGEASEEVGAGAIRGAPFMLSSLAILVTGITVVVFWLLKKRTLEVTINEALMSLAAMSPPR